MIHQATSRPNTSFNEVLGATPLALHKNKGCHMIHLKGFLVAFPFHHHFSVWKSIQSDHE